MTVNGLTVIGDDDRETIAALAEQEVDEGLWAALLGLFGKASLRNRLRAERSKACKGFPERCGRGDCGACVPYLEEPLIGLLAQVVPAYNEGLLEVNDGLLAIKEREPVEIF